MGADISSDTHAAFFRGKKVTVMGLGLLGRGVGDAQYLAECGAELVVTDMKTQEELASSVERLKEFSNIEFVLGTHRLGDFRNKDLILKAAGVPLDSPYIAEAKKNAIPVRMSADLFMEHAGITTIGITGTRGKSTVTNMVAAILEKAGKNVLLGGNIRGVSTLALLPQVTKESIAVLELDSWQCQGLAEAKLSPRIAVFSTLYADHLNYYRHDEAQYLADKANIFLYQSDKDTLVLGDQCASLIIEMFQNRIEAQTKVVGTLDLPDTWALRVPGAHNRYNAALALAAARAAGIDDARSREALATFAGVPGRLELLREYNGIRMYNDTNATTPEATKAALEALDTDGKKRVILIAGGADKQLDMSALRPVVDVHTKAVVWLSGSGTPSVRKEGEPVFDSLEEAFEAACAIAKKGDSILFSPAFASFGMFKNEYDRGDQFNILVKEL